MGVFLALPDLFYLKDHLLSLAEHPTFPQVLHLHDDKALRAVQGLCDNLVTLPLRHPTAR
jgi:hypothetical protein